MRDDTRRDDPPHVNRTRGGMIRGEVPEGAIFRAAGGFPAAKEKPKAGIASGERRVCDWMKSFLRLFPEWECRAFE